MNIQISDDKVTEYEKKKKGFIKRGITTLLSSVKWMFFTILGIGYFIVYGLQVPQEDVSMLLVVGSATFVIIGIFGYIIIDTRWDRRRKRKDKAEISELKNIITKDKLERTQWKESFLLEFQESTSMLKGTVRSLKENIDKSIYMMSKSTALLTDTNILFEQEFGWTYEEINVELETVEYENRPLRMVELLVRHQHDDNPEAIQELISSRIFNGNRIRGRMNDVWLCRKDRSDFSADIIVEAVDESVIIGFVKNTEKEKHRQATDEAVYSILVQFRDHIEGKQNSRTTRKAMTKHLDMMRLKMDEK